MSTKRKRRMTARERVLKAHPRAVLESIFGMGFVNYRILISPVQCHRSLSCTWDTQAKAWAEAARNLKGRGK